MLKKLASLLCLFHATLDNNLVCPNNLYAKSKRGGYNLYGKTMWRLIRIAICMTELDHGRMPRRCAETSPHACCGRIVWTDLWGPIFAEISPVTGNSAARVMWRTTWNWGRALRCVRPIKVEGLCPADLWPNFVEQLREIASKICRKF